MNYIKTILSVVLAGIFMAGCSSPQEVIPVIEGAVSLAADGEQVRCDGADVIEFTVTVTDADGKQHDVTEHAEIYNRNTKTALTAGRFSTETEGEYVFYAVYGLSLSNEVMIRAVNDIPQLPEDPQQENTSFRHRMLLVQHTGTGCVNCPRMMESLKTLSADEQYNGLYHHVASHSYNDGEGDAAYSEAARNLSMVYNTSGNYPSLTFNFTPVSTGTDLSEIKAQIDQLSKQQADAGIAASASLSGDDILVNIEVKSAVKNDYRVAAWILEDDIYSIQTGMSESWHNIHENALRYMAGTVSQFSFAGEKLGSLAKGDKASKVLVLPLEEEWVAENCKVLVMVTAADENGNYDVANCALCQIGETVTYDYK
mgnify:FL=1